MEVRPDGEEASKEGYEEDREQENYEEGMLQVVDFFVELSAPWFCIRPGASRPPVNRFGAHRGFCRLCVPCGSSESAKDVRPGGLYVRAGRRRTVAVTRRAVLSGDAGLGSKRKRSVSADRTEQHE